MDEAPPPEELLAEIARLREDEEQWSRLLDSLPDVVGIFQDEKVAWINQATLEVFGYRDKQEVIGHGILGPVPRAERERLVAYTRARQTEDPDAPKHYYTQFQRTNGETFPVEVYVRPMTYRGRPALLVVAREISERVETEQSLRKSHELYRQLVELSPDSITMTDTQGHFLLANPRAARMYGFETAEDLLSSDLNAFEVIAPEDRQLAFDNAAKLMAGEPLRDVEYTMLRRDGSRFPAALSATVLRDEQGRPEAWLGIVRDISARKRAEQETLSLQAQVQHAQKLESLGVLAGGIAHDFNNLLLGVLGNAGLAQLDLPPGSPAREHLQHIETAALRAAELTQQMLAYSGKGSFVVGPLRLDALVEEIADLLRTAVSKKASLQFQFAPDLPSIRGDASQLRQVVMNLITNASESLGGQPGIITLRTETVEADRELLAASYLDEDLALGRYVALEVRDTGEGMDSETRGRIFDPFFTTKFAGRGLGLAAVLGIVRGHAGAIQVQSEPGHGTAIRVLLPVDEQAGPLPAGGPQDASVQETGLGGLVLVADDEPSVLQTSRAILERLGFEVLGAADGQQALDLAAEHAERLSLALLDLTMPKIDGRQALEGIRRIRPDLPVLLSSGYSEQEVAADLGETSAVGFVQKPYTPRQLMAAIQKLLSAQSPKGAL